MVSRPEGEKAEEQLPRPNPGEPIQAAHFRTIADSIEGLRGALELANALVGRSLDAAVAAVETAGRSVQRIVSTAGIHHDPANIGAIGDRVVLHATPTDAGGLEVNLIVAEPATSAKVVPNLVGLTYGEAVRLMRRTLGDAHPGIAPVAPDLRGQTLDRLDR